MAPSPMTIIISGMAASGKTTLAHRLAKKYDLKLYAGSDALKDFARRRGYNPEGNDWWDTKDGMEFLDERNRDHNFDKEVDKIMMEKAKDGNVVMTSWTLPYLGAAGIKIWLDASKATRSKRMAKRDSISFEEARKIIDERDEKNTTLYKSVYDFILGEKLKENYDIIVECNNMDEEQVFDKVVKTIEEKYR